MRDTLRFRLPYMRGADVVYCQERLLLWGFDPGVADGLFGRRTRAAVKQFQKSAGLEADGVVGRLTWAALDSERADKEHIALLKGWGFGDMLTSLGEERTVRQYQAAMGLTVDGIVGRETLTALRQPPILPRLSEKSLECQCGAAGKNYCDGYPAGRGAGAGVLLLAERIFREVDRVYPNAVYGVPSVEVPAPNGAAAGGYRCTEWNRDRGGASSSRHLEGCAVDIYGRLPGVRDALIRDEIERAALRLTTRGGVGRGARYIVHIDTRGRRARWEY